MSPALDAVVLAGAALIWAGAIVALWSGGSRPGRGRIAFGWIGALLLAGAAVLASNPAALFENGSPERAEASLAAASTSRPEATLSCSQIRTGMNASDLAARMGRPDRTFSAEDRRGPGSELWIWDEARCRVYVFDGRVDFVE